MTRDSLDVYHMKIVTLAMNGTVTTPDATDGMMTMQRDKMP